MLVSSLKKLPLENWLLFIATLINRAGSMALFFLIIYLHNYLGFSIQAGGFILATYGLGALFSGPIGGYLTDRYGPFKIITFSFLLAGIILLMYPFAHNIYLLYILTFSWGLIGESYRPAIQVALSHFSSIDQRTLAFSLNRLAINAGMTIAPILGGLLIEFHFTSVFIIDGLTTLAASIFIYSQFRNHLKSFEIEKSKESLFANFKALLFDKKLLPPMLAFFIILIVFFQMNSTLPVFMINHIHSLPLTFGLVCGINAVLIILFQLWVNNYISNWKNNYVLSTGAALIAVGFGSYVFANSVAVIIFGLLLWTAGEIILFPTIASYVSEIAPTKQQGLYMGIYTMILNAALVFSPIIGTQLLERTGSFFWFICFILGLISALIFQNEIKTNL
jgi:MFS family permease